MPRNGGYLYATTDANGNKIGINTDEISACINENSHDIVTLGISTKVNKMNKNKPYRRTTPEVPSRTVDSWANGTGKYLGNRGEATGYPVYWGMRYPMNTAQQNGSGSARSNLLELCYDVTVRQGQGESGRYHPNYEYQKPVAGTDYCSEDDFDGYHHNAGAFLDAGVAGATAGQSAPATLSVNKFENASISIWAHIPSDSIGWDLKDIIYDGFGYYLVAEFYTTSMWVFKSSGSPFKTVHSAATLGAGGRSLVIDVPIADIIKAGGFSSSGSFQFYVCVGFNKVSGSSWAASAAFVAPWKTGAHKCATLVKVVQASPYVVSFTKYCFDPSTTFVDFPTSTLNVGGNQTSMKFQASVQNHASTALKIYGPKYLQSNGLIFRAKAVGSYGAYNTDNARDGLTSDDSNGLYRVMSVGTGAGVNVTNSSDNITVAANTTSTLYFFAGSLLPYGYTIGIIIEVSNDGGATWATTGMRNCQFNRLP